MKKPRLERSSSDGSNRVFPVPSHSRRFAKVNPSAQFTVHAPRRAVRFMFSAPGASSVSVAGTFNDWQVDANPLVRGSDDVWRLGLELPTGRYEYRYIVDGKWTDDPTCAEFVANPFGGCNAVVYV
jgi:1,4-alpha-glucan branching enzyme